VYRERLVARLKLRRKWEPVMLYRNSEMKIDQIISYFNERKINLAPPFQRGQVWPLKTRQKLMRNIVQGRPIPAIFLYKEASGSKYSYNILDGKQRLESLLLFVGDKRSDMAIQKVTDYFFEDKSRSNTNFTIELSGKKRGFKDLDETLVRDFREYAIPTIEISLSDESSSLDEIINLFVDINQQGVPVNRFDVVKAMSKDPLLRQIFGFVAIRQKRGEALFYRAKRNEFVFVLKKLQIVESLPDGNSKVDRMWERLTELALFAQSSKHRTPVEILKSFIKTGDLNPKLSGAERERLRGAFVFLRWAYQHSPLAQHKLATDQPQFYTMVTSLIGTNLLSLFPREELMRKLVAFGAIADGQSDAPGSLDKLFKSFKELASRQTTNVGRRDDRQKRFIEAIRAL